MPYAIGLCSGFTLLKPPITSDHTHDNQITDKHVNKEKDESDHLRQLSEIADECLRLRFCVMVNNRKDESTQRYDTVLARRVGRNITPLGRLYSPQ